MPIKQTCNMLDLLFSTSLALADAASGMSFFLEWLDMQVICNHSSKRTGRRVYQNISSVR